MTVMGLDYGSRTVGIAVSDALFLTAQPLETVTRDSENKLRRTLARIALLAKERRIGLFVLGRPLNMNGTAGERVEKCEAFRELLIKRTGIPVVWQDERLTTVAADEILADSGVRREERKRYIDQVAACLILEEYMKAHPEAGKAAPGEDGAGEVKDAEQD